MIVLNGLEVLVLDQTVESEETEGSVVDTEQMQISFNSFLGVSSFTTTNIKGSLRKMEIVVMLDNGATHNFITPSAFNKAKLKVNSDKDLEIYLGTRMMVSGAGICKDVLIQLKDMEFSADFIVLDLDSADVILGIEWLRTLGKCMMDWENHVLSFSYKGQHITLHGDPELHSHKLSLKSLQSEHERRVMSRLAASAAIE